MHAWLTVLATVAMAGTSIFQWWAINETNELTRQSAADNSKAQEAALALTREQIHAQNRPSLVPAERAIAATDVEGTKVLKFTANVPTLVRLVWVNGGPQPALDNRGTTCFRVAPERPGLETCIVNEGVEHIVVGPGQRTTGNVNVVLTPEQVIALNAKKSRLWVLGSVRYTDAFLPQHVHFSAACFVYTPEKATFVGCGGVIE